ncbi:putative multiple sugar transport system substrate-binding protein [Cryobacterium flavum]|uniref:Putative multiple sugar transport system substrate-binding protein n=1 Tax=Cryobacterium flavum TaxID=1424659 RepID=A0A4R8V534_9MICO|nr:MULTISPECIES: sugar-binding protein [Cryobacterium]TFB77819.1 sugar ABC transporter substrate-binding protein [Cryobacterium flavum]TFD10129.1 sugar ABC transporter substrate-binding protein [Cryobacterium sp. TMT1-66-1]TFD13888.1 sugar ABC transporter substrate-binding protein [Cryobacterium sp. TMT1-2-2]SDM61553.1 putative multiple sugar transport system substrate-binding protein [Cryobacterium flavum]
MKKILLAATAVMAVAALGLTGCSSDTGRGSAAGTDAPASGFSADSLIGVALPDKTSENWVLAGSLFEKGLADAGFKGDVQYAGASNAVADQQQQISTMVTNGAKVIIIGAKDGAQLSTQVADAKAAGVTVIAYDRLILNTDDVDYYVAFDNFKVGQLQGQALLDGMAAKFPDKTSYNVELFSGSADDSNSAVFFNGAMDVLQPKIDDGTLKIVSGQTDIGQTATDGWKPENAQRRMDTLMQGTYQTESVDGVLSPNDTLARAIITSVQDAGQAELPVVTGQDSEAASIPLIMSGVQYSTIYKDTRALVKEAIAMASALQSGDKPTVNDTKSYDNGNKIVPADLLTPVIVTAANAVEAYAENPELSQLTK